MTGFKAALLAQLPGWVGTSHAAQAAAVEAARQVALAESMVDGVARAQHAAAGVIVSNGIDQSDLLDVTVTANPSGDLQRGQEVTVTVTVRGNPIVVPGLGSVGNPFDAAPEVETRPRRVRLETADTPRETAPMTKKMRNLRERPTASFAIDPPGFIAMAEGIGRIIEGGEAHAINRRLRQKYLTAEAVETVGAAWGTVDDVAVEITPHRWRSWSNEVLRELSSQSAGDLPPDRWWVSE